MNTKKTLVGVAIWALTVALTLLLFFVVLNDYSATRVTALVFVLISQLVGLVMFLSTDIVGKKGEAVLYNASVYSSTGIYFVATLIISLIFVIANTGTKWLALLNGIILILYAIVFVVILFATSVLGEKNRKILNAVSNIKQIEIRLLSLKEQPKNKPYQPNLNKLYEQAKYCDNTVYTADDVNIENLLTDLEQSLNADYEGVSENAVNIINQMIDLFKQRNEQVKANKGGGF